MKLDDLKGYHLGKARPDAHKDAFKAFLKDIVHSIKEDDISFNQFMLILAKNNIKFYCLNEFKKICKIFHNHLEAIPKALPFSYMHLHHAYKQDNQYYYLVDISSKKVQLFVNDGVEIHQHDVEKCLRDFILIMKKRYGKEINWFKVISGMTVSVTIQIDTFKENIKEIMKNSRHSKCVQRMAEAFQDPLLKCVSWNKFMKVIKKPIYTIQQELKEGKSQIRIPQNNLYFKRTSHTIRQRTKTEIKQQMFSLQRQQKPIQNHNSFATIKSKTNSYFYTRNNTDYRVSDNPILQKMRSNTENSQNFNDFIVMKKCSLHSKFDLSKSFLNKEAQIDQTAKISAFNSQTIQLDSAKKKQTFFWNYLKNKRKRQL